MDSDAKFNPPVGRDARVALDHSGLHFDCATGRIDHTAEFSDEPVAGALDDPAMVRGDRRLDQIAEERAEPRERSLLVRAGEPAIADDIGDQDRRDFPGLAHGASSCIPFSTRPRLAAELSQSCNGGCAQRYAAPALARY